MRVSAALKPRFCSRLRRPGFVEPLGGRRAGLTSRSARSRSLRASCSAREASSAPTPGTQDRSARSSAGGGSPRTCPCDDPRSDDRQLGSDKPAVKRNSHLRFAAGPGQHLRGNAQARLADCRSSIDGRAEVQSPLLFLQEGDLLFGFGAVLMDGRGFRRRGGDLAEIMDIVDFSVQMNGQRELSRWRTASHRRRRCPDAKGRPR